MNNFFERFCRMSPERQRYTLQTLPTHLADAGQGERLQCVLSNFNFLQAKMEALGLSCMIEDYHLASIPDLLSSGAAQNLRLTQEAIRLSIHILAQQTTQMIGQLLGSVLLNETFEPLRQQAKQWKSKTDPWLRPFTSNLVPAGGGMPLNMTSAFGQTGLRFHGSSLMHTSTHQPSNMWEYASSMVGRTLAGSMASMIGNHVR